MPKSNSDIPDKLETTEGLERLASHLAGNPWNKMDYYAQALGLYDGSKVKGISDILRFVTNYLVAVKGMSYYDARHTPVDVIAGILRDDYLAKNTKTGGKTPKQRRKRLTDREREVLGVYSECGRNAAEAARQLDVTKQYVSQVVKNAHAKVDSASASGRSKRPDQTLPTDSDGQEYISEQLGKADTTRSRKTHVRKRF